MNVRFDLVSVFPSSGSRRVRACACAAGLALGALSCRGERENPSSAGDGAAAYAFHVKTVDWRFDTREAFIAAVEMQLSGEPFAQAMGRDLGGYTRDYACQGSVWAPSVNLDPAATAPDGGVPAPRIDLAGFSAAIESYEYSKQPMNDIAFESGAGTSLLFGPVLDGQRGGCRRSHRWTQGHSGLGRRVGRGRREQFRCRGDSVGRYASGWHDRQQRRAHR